MLNLPDGVTVEIENEAGEVAEIHEDGYIGVASCAQQVTMRLIVSNLALLPVHVDGANNVVKARVKKIDEGAVYTRVVDIKLSDRKPHVFHTEYPQNSIRLVGRVSETEIRAWQIALVSQNGFFHLTSFVSHEGQVYRKEDGSVTAPVLHKWTGHEKVLTPLFRCLSVPPLEEYEPYNEFLDDVELPPEHQKENRAVVLFFNPARGFGALKTRRGEIVRFHWTAIDRNGGRLKHVDRGEIVHFSQVDEPEQTTHRTTSFKQEAGRVIFIST
ncbi:MAG: hypothetical protein WDZ70_00455 [Candidatus Paceibacterota bacterium]